MNTGSRIVQFSLKHYRLVTWMMVALTVVILLAAALPSLRLIDAMPEGVKRLSRSMSFLPTISVDTDPENMLSPQEPVRVFNDEMKRRMSLHDMVVVGVVNETDPNGVFNPSSLAKIKALTDFAKTLQFDSQGKLIPPGPEKQATDENDLNIEGLNLPADEPASKEAVPAAPKLSGVIPGDVIAPSTVDSVEPRGGAIVFEWLMRDAPRTKAEAEQVRRKAQRVPFLAGTLVSDDGKAVALYLPITRKNLSYAVYQALKRKIAELGEGPEQFHITGLPVAEDTFGVEMFIQMAISAPAAMIVIFVLMLVFFRKLLLVLSPMILALVCVIVTMGFLVICGFPIHIMSSMIPIFIMPIAVLDSIHILSEFFERYQITRDRVKTMQAVMDELFQPMLYTSLTSVAGFASLATTPIPPVQVFGLFVGAGIMLAWILTVTFIPAFVMFIPERRLANFGAKRRHEDTAQPVTSLGRFLRWMGGVTYRQAKPILAGAALLAVISGYGISRIRINDNPVKWFTRSHPIRVADKVLNQHFGGTYMAYLAMEADQPKEGEVFKRPAVLRWQRSLQDALGNTGVVGKSNSLADIVRTVHRDLYAKDVNDPNQAKYFRIPDTREAVAQCLLQFQSSHRYGDIDHFVTPDYRTASLWVQLKSGDNRDMEKVAHAVNDFIAKNPPPVPLKIRWFGLTYINVIWQDKMVAGMLRSFSGSFLVVFLMMVVLFRSVLWGLLSMVPLTVTIGAIYGAVGLVGKDYDMPVAVLSSLTLGLAVDFAIHFLSRAREAYRREGSWEATAPAVFGEPARAIARNIIVIAAGFLPLLLAPLVPYKTVGILLATILLASGVATLLILPALIRVFEKRLFHTDQKVMNASCNCGLCLVASITAVVTLAVNLYGNFGWGAVTWVSVIGIPVMVILCGLMSRRAKCRIMKQSSASNSETDHEQEQE